MKKLVLILLCFSLVFGIFSLSAGAKEESVYKYYMGEVEKVKKDTGYSEPKEIGRKDPHFGWDLGEFFVSGYTSDCKDEDGSPVFLKNVGDTVTLWFTLNEDLDKLHGNDKLLISEDKNGYDEYFGIERTNFGKGTLIVRKRDSENHWGDPVIYTDFLAAKATEGADTQVDLFEEGDYEVALNYEIKEINMNLFGWKPFPSYHNYRIFFRFSVRNGNCMVFPFDALTGSELGNTSFTENGFYLDLANSKYLEINVMREVLNDGATGLSEDVRFNRPAKDGEQYTEEGIYTITAHNVYTDQTTVKKIYVGTNSILKAHVTTGFSVEEINYLLTQGATIAEDGKLISVDNQYLVKPDPVEPEDVPTPQEQEQEYDVMLLFCVAAIVVLFVLCFVILIVVVTNKNKSGVKKGGVSEE